MVERSRKQNKSKEIFGGVKNRVYFRYMKGKEKPILESVKVDKKYLDMVRDQKKKTWKPIGVFIAEAIVEKIELEKEKK